MVNDIFVCLFPRFATNQCYMSYKENNSGFILWTKVKSLTFLLTLVFGIFFQKSNEIMVILYTSQQGSRFRWGKWMYQPVPLIKKHEKWIWHIIFYLPYLHLSIISHTNFQKGVTTASIYSASKAAVESMTIAAAKEWAKVPIRCNCIRPGYVWTPMINHHPEEILNKLKKATAMDRFGKPEGVSNLIKYRH